eukprot:TRINITY_DN6875_c0_g1_i1.p1 TRINITY_DN6875_c0_g1~~TRINITY_DN6875_c0_g1_i1.p1  ORF type:complete len:341 (-),score=52.14 TRINITY_DN6875_c0_g1_i1:69-1091(-)
MIPPEVQQMYNQDPAYLNQQITCRNCLSAEYPEEFIAPCNCQGPQHRYVHRSCLDTWRAVSPNPHSFYVCDVCRAPYHVFEEVQQDPLTKLKFAFIIARDVLLAILAFAVIVMVIGWLFEGIGNVAGLTEILDDVFDQYLNNNDEPFDSMGSFPRALIYGFIMFFFFLGITVLFWGCMKCLEDDDPDYEMHQSYPYRHDSYLGAWLWIYWTPFYWPSYHLHTFFCCYFCCNTCSHTCALGASHASCGDGDCDGEGAGGLCLAIIIIILIIAAIGAIFGSLFAFFMFFKLLKRHLRILQKKSAIRRQYVANLEDPDEVAQSSPIDVPNTIVVYEQTNVVSV